MRKTSIAMLLLLLLCSFLWAFPRIAVGELFSNSDCDGCNAAHQFLLENRILWEDSAAVLRYHLSDGLELDENWDRYIYYDDYADSMGYVPHMFIDGEDYYSNFSNWIIPMNEHAEAGSFVGIEEFMHTPDSIAVRVFLEESGHDGEYYMLAVLTVDGLSDEGNTYNWVVQRVYTDGAGEPFDLAYGDSVDFEFAFDGDPAWDPHDCIFVACVIGPELPTIQNALKTMMYRRPDYDFAISTDRKKDICTVGGTAEFTVFVADTGRLDDTYTLQLVPLSVPGDWDAYMFSGDTETEVAVASLEYSEVPITVEANSAGVAKFAIVASTDEIPGRYDTLYFTAGAGLDVLLFNDSATDDSMRYVNYLEGADEIYLYWDPVIDGELIAFSTLGIDKVVWFCGEDTADIIQGGESEQLQNYILSMNGKVMISGSGIGYVHSGDFALYRMSLAADYGGAASSFSTITALDGYEPLSGWSGSISGISGAEIIDPYTAFGSVGVFLYGDGSSAGIAKDDGSSRVLYFGCPIEAISSTASFNQFMDKCLQFLDEGFSGIVDRQTPGRMSLSAAPNPFNSACWIEYTIPQGIGKIDILTTDGRKIASTEICGQGRFTWNPQDAPSGIYLVRLSIGDVVRTIPIALVK